jgi:nucleoside-diphosphate-sugar epimerase
LSATNGIEPITVYGISKYAGEFWCNYYFHKFGVDIRSLRYPGLISYKSAPGGGTTDYAIEIFHAALEDQSYTSFLQPDTYLPMMYMPDAIRATIELMEAPAENISIRTSYNISAMSFSPAEISDEIKREFPNSTSPMRLTTGRLLHKAGLKASTTILPELTGTGSMSITFLLWWRICCVI